MLSGTFDEFKALALAERFDEVLNAPDRPMPCSIRTIIRSRQRPAWYAVTCGWAPAPPTGWPVGT